MHNYLRSIGFSAFGAKRNIDDFFKKNLTESNLLNTYKANDGRLIGQYKIPVCHDAAICVIGEEDRNQLANIDYYFPIARGYDYTLVQECTIERYSDKDSFAGIIDDHRFGIALIFYLINTNEYNRIIKSNSIKNIKIDKIYLSGLSLSGKIILPIDKKETQYKYSNYVAVDTKESSIKNLKEVSANFDPVLNIENDDYSIYKRVNERYQSEDLYSIIETSILPYGIECDKYNIVANIISVSYKKNNYTDETIVEMRLNALGLIFTLIINEKDLVGEPKPGRRFKGNVWLQGEIEFLIKDEEKQKKSELKI